MKLFQILNGKVTIVSDNQTYDDIIENYILDSGNIKKDGEKIASAVYDSQQNYCEVNGKVSIYPSDFFESIINSIDILIEKKKKREHIAPSLDELKSEKLQKIKTWVSLKIESGFVSSATGSPVKYNFDTETQLAVQSALLASASLFAEKFPNGFPIRGYKSTSTDPQGKIIWSSKETTHTLSAEQLQKWCADLSLHVSFCKQKGWIKQDEVNACKTERELKSIVFA